MLDMTSFDAALKEVYTDDAVEDMVYKNNPFFALVPKNKEFYGDSYVIPVIYGNPQGRSANFARAQTRGAASSSALVKFVLTRVKDYGIATIDNETILASKNNMGAFLRAATLEIDGIINAVKRSIAVKLYRAGWGDIGRVGSFSTTTITLKDTADIVNFEVGMELVLSSSQNAAALRANGSSTNGLIVTGVNRSTGVLTFAFNVNDATNGVPAIANDDWIFIRGDREDSATPTRLVISGLQAWLPNGSPTSTAFFGVDRTKDASRLAGLYYDGSAVPIEEALIEGASRVGREGQDIDYYFVSFSKFSSLEKALGSKVQYVDVQANARIGFRGIRVNGPNGEIIVMPDPNCPNGFAFGCKLKSWELCSIGEPVRVIDTDGLEMLRLNTQDGVEVRYGNYGNLGCHAPGSNIVVAL